VDDQSSGRSKDWRWPQKYSASCWRAARASSAGPVAALVAVPAAGTVAPAGGAPNLTRATPSSPQPTDTTPTGVSSQDHSSVVTPPLSPPGLTVAHGRPVEMQVGVDDQADVAGRHAVLVERIGRVAGVLRDAGCSS
jgi:hypothetical protein